MTPSPAPLVLAEALESAYRLALVVEGLAHDRLPHGDEARVPSDAELWVLASELLRVLDAARASMLSARTGSR